MRKKYIFSLHDWAIRRLRAWISSPAIFFSARFAHTFFPFRFDRAPAVSIFGARVRGSVALPFFFCNSLRSHIFFSLRIDRAPAVSIFGARVRGSVALLFIFFVARFAHKGSKGLCVTRD